MKHLGMLERCGLVEVRRSGRERWNILNAEPLRSIEGRWAGAPVEQAARPAPPDRLAEPGLAVARSAEAGHLVSVQVFIDAVPWRVFDALTVNIAAWWGAPHLGSADASNLVVEPQPGGRFIEEWGHRQGMLRGVVTAIRQDERLVLSGTILRTPGAGLDVRLERREGGTLLTAALSRMPGAGEGEDEGRAALDDLFRVRLKAFVESGTRSGVSS